MRTEQLSLQARQNRLLNFQGTSKLNLSSSLSLHPILGKADETSKLVDSTNPASLVADSTSDSTEKLEARRPVNTLDEAKEEEGG